MNTQHWPSKSLQDILDRKLWVFNLFLVSILLIPVNPVQRRPVENVGDLWLDVSIGAPLISWFNGAARPTDIARIENPTQIDLFELVTTGRKLIVFKSIAEAERMLPDIATQIDIIGYNLENGPANPADEQANPLASAQRMRELADEYNLVLAFGPDHDIALSDGVAIAPFVDIFVLQVQRVQTEHQTVDEFVKPLIPQLRAANPGLQVTIQVRTEGDVDAIAELIESLKDDLDGVSILTSPDTVPVAEDLVETLRPDTVVTNPPAAATAVSIEDASNVIEHNEQRNVIRNGGLIVLVVVGGVVALFLFSRRRE
jgi:hypothetical protein